MSANESKLLRRLLRPTRLTTQDVAHFMKSHAIIHGKTIGKDGDSTTDCDETSQAHATLGQQPDVNDVTG